MRLICVDIRSPHSNRWEVAGDRNKAAANGSKKVIYVSSVCVCEVFFCAAIVATCTSHSNTQHPRFDKFVNSHWCDADATEFLCCSLFLLRLFCLEKLPRSSSGVRLNANRISISFIIQPKRVCVRTTCLSSRAFPFSVSECRSVSDSVDLVCICLL